MILGKMVSLLGRGSFEQVGPTVMTSIASHFKECPSYRAMFSNCLLSHSTACIPVFVLR